MFLKLLPPPPQYLRQFFQLMFVTVETAVNYLTEQNFPNPLDGDTLIKTGTLSGSALKNDSVAVGKLAWQEWVAHTFVALMMPFSTTDTAGVNGGDYFGWDPTKFPGGKWYLEASMAVANSAATATLTLVGAADIGSITTTNTTLTRVRSGALTMPTTAQNLWVKLKTSNASYAAMLAGAKLIFVPD